MNRRRSLSSSKFSASETVELSSSMSGPPSPYLLVSGAHSRDPSSASTTSSPSASTMSPRGHNRWPSSSSSLASDSPTNLTKSSLHDLLEEPDPAETHDDRLSDLPLTSAASSTATLPDEPFCICDTTFCEHRQTPTSPGLPSPIADEWAPGDDFSYFNGADLSGKRASKRRRSGDFSAESLTSRLSRHWPSLSKRWKTQIPGPSTSSPGLHSAPVSHASSIRLPSLRRSQAAQTEHSFITNTPPYTPVDAQAETNVLSRSRASSKATKGLVVAPLVVALEPLEPGHDEDMLDPEVPEPASTPLLPPTVVDRSSQSLEDLRSPLQSPTVAGPATPPSSRAIGYVTPPLSSHPSAGSLHGKRPSDLTWRANSDVPPMHLSQPIDSSTRPNDHWSARLGHANFHISPAPRPMEGCDLQSLSRLRDEWEMARMEYMRIAQRVSEHYGPTSQTFHLTEAKWRDIDEQWKKYHEEAHSRVEASGATALFQPLAATQHPSRMPELDDPQQKFPRLEGADIVGPMVTYAKIQRRPSRKATFLKLFTDPASLLNGRAQFGLRR